jgi:hypothetical protein
MRRVTDPDGCVWEVRAFRVRLPPWRQIDGGDDGSLSRNPGDLVDLLFALVTLPFTMLLIPLAIAVVELPVAVARSIGSDTRWVEAATHFPREERLLWRTTRADVTTVYASVASMLASGERLQPLHAELVERTGLV